MNVLNPVRSAVKRGPAPVIFGVGLALATPAMAQARRDPDITVEADARDVIHKLISVRESIKVNPGPMTLLYPQWIQGHHAPTGQIGAVAGLVVEANGRPLRWQRQPQSPFALDITVPAGVSRLTLRFDRIGALTKGDGESFSSTRMARIDWPYMLFYPAGRPVTAISTQASLHVPAGWQVTTSLESIGASDGIYRFAPVTLEQLADSPAYAAQFLGRNNVTGGTKPISIDIAAENVGDTIVPPAQLAMLGRTFDQVRKTFGSQPYPHYNFLVTLTNRLTGQGVEHQASSEDSLPPTYFSDPDGNYTLRHLLVHEYVHAWNGKLHRPATIAVPDFNTPMQNELLWVYEGLTTYLDHVLTVRGGLWTMQDGRDMLAHLYADYDHEAGRQWRSLQDTTARPLIGDAPAWTDWGRTADYYNEGVLLWLDVDLRLRRLTGGRRSLDDFAKTFLGGGDRDQTVRPYSFGDVVKALQAVAPADWATLLRQRLDSIGGPTPKDGLAHGGYRLVYDSYPSAWQEHLERRFKGVALDYSWGTRIGLDGKVQMVSWGSAAFAAGLLPGDRVIAIDGQTFTAERLRAAVTNDQRATELDVDGNDGPRKLRLSWTGGLRYPHLEPIAGQPARLDEIFKPL